MKMGIKEFRERLGEVSLGNEVVIVTHHGKRVGRYVPEREMPSVVDMEAWAKERKAFAKAWRSSTPDWRDRLIAAGIPSDDIDD